MRFLYFIIGLGVGFFCIRYNKWLVDNLGIRWPALESILGPGGMYTIWKLAGVILICLGIYILFGGFGL